MHALAYVSEAEDIDRLSPYLRHASARTRAQPLRGLVRAQALVSEKFLGDSSGWVVRIALRLVSREGALLDADELAEAYVAALSEAIRRQLPDGSRLLGK